MAKKLVLIAAVSNGGVIGMNGKIPWVEDKEFRFKIGDDMSRFVRLTTGNAVIMGRKTYESIGKPLRDRFNVVVSRNPSYLTPSSEMVCATSVEDALGKARGFSLERDVYVIGGGEIYRDTIESADRLEITHIHRDFEGDSFFPQIDLDVWKRVGHGPRAGYEFATYERK